MRDLALIVPSRGRPGNIYRLWTTLQETCQGDTQLIVGLDADDEANYDRLPGVEYVVSDSLRHVGPWINHLATAAQPQYRFIGHIGDDNIASTPGWDVQMMEALGGTRFAFGNDLYPREPGSLCCHLFTRSGTVEKLGYLAVPSIKHMWVDPVWMAWGRACGITYLHEVYLRHLHFTGGGNAPYDDTYQRSVLTAADDKAAFDTYCGEQLNADIEKLGGTPYTPEMWAAFKASLFIP
jgi:hypothetical protein